jgi:AcrR family transcriptional regulator
MTVNDLGSAPATARFASRRERIVDVGSRLINDLGLKGLSLGAVAEQIGLGSSSVTYYFRRKDLLAEACYDRGLDALEAQVEASAAAAADPRGRIAGLVATTVADADEAERPDARGLAQLHEMRAMEEPIRSRLIRRYFNTFRIARGYFTPAATDEQRLVEVMRTQVLLEAVHALPGWLRSYAAQEHERVGDRLVELLACGLAPAGAAPAVTAGAERVDEEGDAGQARFLGAATRLINERGYRGASVERIASALNVTKGSFYHHLQAKDDLVLACFRRSLEVIERAQDRAVAAPGSWRDRLAAALGGLIGIQFGEGAPLLRSTALVALPPDLRREALRRNEQAARRFSGMIIDGITEGSLAPVDPLVAGQVIMSVLNVAYELRDLSRRTTPERAVALYGSLIFQGLLAAVPA